MSEEPSIEEIEFMDIQSMNIPKDRYEELEARVKKLEEEILLLNQIKCNARPFQWLNHRVGQIERRLDKSLDDGWEGDFEGTG